MVVYASNADLSDVLKMELLTVMAVGTGESFVSERFLKMTNHATNATMKRAGMIMRRRGFMGGVFAKIAGAEQ
jgi:hypothetical protein